MSDIDPSDIAVLTATVNYFRHVGYDKWHQSLLQLQETIDIMFYFIRKGRMLIIRCKVISTRISYKLNIDTRTRIIYYSHVLLPLHVAIPTNYVYCLILVLNTVQLLFTNCTY